MSLPVKVKDVVDALEMSDDESANCIDRRTGEIIFLNLEEIAAAENQEPLEDYAEWQRATILKARETLDSEDFIELPTKFDIHEYSIMEEYSRKRDPRGELARSLRGSGAFRRFRRVVHELGIQDHWYAFRQQRLEEIAIDWLESEKIPYTREK